MSAPANLTDTRRYWRARPDASGSATVLLLCDEIEQLRLALDRAERAADYSEREAKALRYDLARIREAVVAALHPKPALWTDILGPGRRTTHPETAPGGAITPAVNLGRTNGTTDPQETP